MFHRVIQESWHAFVPFTAFALTFCVFATALVRAMLMKMDRSNRLASLPLDESPAATSPGLSGGRSEAAPDHSEESTCSRGGCPNQGRCRHS